MNPQSQLSSGGRSGPACSWLGLCAEVQVVPKEISPGQSRGCMWPQALTLSQAFLEHLVEEAILQTNIVRFAWNSRFQIHASSSGETKNWDTLLQKEVMLLNMGSLNSEVHFLRDCRINHQICLIESQTWLLKIIWLRKFQIPRRTTGQMELRADDFLANQRLTIDSKLSPKALLKKEETTPYICLAIKPDRKSVV